MVNYTGSKGNDAANGDRGNDYMSGEGGNDRLNAGDGQDTVYGGTGNDTVDGGSGNDYVFGDDGNDVVVGGTGDDYVSGGTGNDTLDLGDGNDTASAGADDDTVYGGAGNDGIWGENGRDLVFGGTGDDTLFGGANGDTLDGGEDADKLYGGAGTDSLLGGAGNDIIYGDVIFAKLYASSGSSTGTGQVTNLSYFSVDINIIDAKGVPVFLATLKPGGTYSGPTATTFNFLLTETGTANQLASFPGTASGPFYSYAADLNDTIDGGSGDDSISGDAGADLLFGGTGNDTVAGGNGADIAYGGDGNDLLTGDAGNDTLSGGTGDDAVFGGTGDDTISGNAGTDYLYGGEGHDQVFGGDGDDQSFGGAGNDSLFGGNDNDIIYGGDGNDVLGGDAGNDLLSGDAGADHISGGDGTDTLLGSSGNDTLKGGAGDDVLRGGTGVDVLSGGAGDDRFLLSGKDGDDVVTDFDTTLTKGRSADQLDVSELSHSDRRAVRAWDVKVTDDGFGNARLTFPMGESVVLQGIKADAFAKSNLMSAIGVPCFVQDTRIATPTGSQRVQDIAAGDLVLNAAGRAVPVIWRGGRDVDADDLAQHPGLAPIWFAPGAIGNHAPLFLSAQHAVCVPGVVGALIRAQHVADYRGGALVAAGLAPVRYHHLMLARHDLLIANGAIVESFYPGPVAMAALTHADQIAVARAVLSLAGHANPVTGLSDIYGARCHPLLSRKSAAKALVNRDRSVVRHSFWSQSVPLVQSPFGMASARG